MRSIFLKTVAMSIAIVEVLAVTGAAAEELPVRKPGRWQLTTVAQTIGMKTFETCITASDSIVTGANQGDCTAPDVKRIDDETFINVVCKRGGGTEKISTLLTGDLVTWYRAVSKITFNPPQDGITHMGATVDGKYLGPACNLDEAASSASK